MFKADDVYSIAKKAAKEPNGESSVDGSVARMFMLSFILTTLAGKPDPQKMEDELVEMLTGYRRFVVDTMLAAQKDAQALKIGG
jgi:hypothetical protein